MPDDFSNPLAPPDHHRSEDAMHAAAIHAERHPLKNDDFRKFLTTPRVSAGEKPHTATAHSFTHKGVHSDVKRKTEAKQHRKQKHVRPKKEDDDDLDEIMKNYRDRARERRDGENKEHRKDIDLLQATAGYRAVAPDLKATMDAAERRKQLIEESKYLGGDMEHTHLVKGLDYALLQKVRSEITSKEKEGEELEKIYQARKTEREEVESEIQSTLAKSIYNTLFKSEPLKLNELFAPRRMAYVVELDDEYAETDIPTSLIRSKQECPVDEASTNLSINDIVIQKLTQVLAYLRTDSKKKKKEKEKEKGKEKVDDATRVQVASESIYDVPGEYVPDLKRPDGKRSKKVGGYFERLDDEDARTSKSDRGKERKDRDRDQRNADKDGDTKRTDKRRSSGWAQNERLMESMEAAGVSRAMVTDDSSKGPKSNRDPLHLASSAQDGGIRMNVTSEPNSYAECYPDGYECYDAAGDSDDDVDYSKMDLGNKKGPIRRWDFDTEQEYEDYMSQREAMPKAAFQYGVKMNDGRKTRKIPGQKTEADQKAKIDRQWNQISQILSKRQGESDGSESVYKKPKY